MRLFLGHINGIYFNRKGVFALGYVRSRGKRNRGRRHIVYRIL